MEKCNGVRTGERTIATTFLSYVCSYALGSYISVCQCIEWDATVACTQRRWNGMCEGMDDNMRNGNWNSVVWSVAVVMVFIASVVALFLFLFRF